MGLPPPYPSGTLLCLCVSYTHTTSISKEWQRKLVLFYLINIFFCSEPLLLAWCPPASPLSIVLFPLQGNVCVHGGVGRGQHGSHLSQFCPHNIGRGMASPHWKSRPSRSMDTFRPALNLPTSPSRPRPPLRPATVCHAVPPMKAPVAPPPCGSSTCQKTRVQRNLLPRGTSLVSSVLAGRWHPGPRPKAMPTSKGRSCF